MLLFIQDEYDRTHRAWYWIKRLGFQLIFTVVPEDNISLVYPPEEFPNIQFKNVLTGYIPDSVSDPDGLTPPSKREIFVGYRGRPLHIRYGKLGQEKSRIGELVAEYCQKNNIPYDIGVKEKDRIYGSNWYDFIHSCRAVLGTESGSNVFDWDGDLDEQIGAYRHLNRHATNEEIYNNVINKHETPGLMNQISPRVFEAIALRTALVLFEGNYSGIILPENHYIPLKKDGSNLDQVFELIGNDQYLDELTERVYRDVIKPGKYTYHSFIHYIDSEIEKAYENIKLKFIYLEEVKSAKSKQNSDEIFTGPITTDPIISLMQSLVISRIMFIYFKIKSKIRVFLRIT